MYFNTILLFCQVGLENNGNIEGHDDIKQDLFGFYCVKFDTVKGQ